MCKHPWSPTERRVYGSMRARPNAAAACSGVARSRGWADLFALGRARWLVVCDPVPGRARRTTCKGSRRDLHRAPKPTLGRGAGVAKNQHTGRGGSQGRGVCALRAPSNARPCSGCVLVRVNLFEPERPSGRVQCGPFGTTHKHPTGAVLAHN